MPDRADVGSDRSDWALQAADTIERVVGAVRDKTTARFVGMARWVVYGMLAAVVGVMTLLVAIILLVRILDVVARETLGVGVWLPYLVLGGIFTALGFFLWSKRTARQPTP